MKTGLLALLLSLALTAQAAAKARKTVRVGLLEALASGDTSSSDRYRRAFEAAIYYAVGEAEKSLDRCGYQLQIEPAYYATSDRTTLTKAAVDLEQKDTWIAFGPRRSDDVLLALPSMPTVPLVSPMANSDAIYTQKPPVFTMYRPTSDFVAASVQALAEARYGTRYAFFVDATSPAAVDFEKGFDAAVQAKGWAKAFSLDAAGEEPDLAPLLVTMEKAPIDFLVLPNNSKFSGYTIANIHKKFPKVKFFGTHGWGDHVYGFVAKYGISPDAVGMCVRVGRKLEDMSAQAKIHSLDYEWNSAVVGPNFTAQAAVHFIRTLAADLCRWKPKDRAAFAAKLAAQPSNRYRLREPFGVYTLFEGKLKFSHVLGK